MKKQICLHVFNDFKSFLVNEIELTIKHYDWSKRLFKVSLFVHLKKIKFQKISFYTKFFFFPKEKEKEKKTHFKKNSIFNFFFLFKLHLNLILYERGTQATFSKAQSQLSKKKNIHFKTSKKKIYKTLFFGTTFRPDSL